MFFGAMSPANTCLILGAGASREPYGYPLGKDLRRRILKYCRSPPGDCAPPDKLATTWDQLKAFARRFESEKGKTIDQFMQKLQGEKNREPREHGRMALAKVLGDCEDPQVQPGWYRLLCSHLQGFSKSNPLRVVTLNYDRSLEFFVSRHWQEMVGCSIPESRQRIREVMQIQHLYGRLADLPHFGGKFEVEYGEMGQQGWNAWNARGLDFIWSQIDPDTEQTCRQWIRQSEYVIVLGFGYHEENVRRLGLHRLPRGNCLFSSGFGLCSKQRKRVRQACSPAKVHFGGRREDVPTYLQRTGVLESVARGRPPADLMKQLRDRRDGVE
jgi:hypothetical protein